MPKISDFQQDKLNKLEEAINDFIKVSRNETPEIIRLRRDIQRAIDDYNMDTL